jgi:chromosome segregation ATPase
MTEFLSKILNPLNLDGKIYNHSLKQGARFNIMQNTIIQPTLGNLDLMSQTTGNGVGSITETMKNMDIDFTKSLDDLDKKEVSTLAKGEGVYNSLINQMKAKQVQMNKLIMAQKGKESIDALKKEIEKLDTQIMVKANEITQNSHKANNANNNVEKDMEHESQKLHKQMMMLKSKKNELDALLQKQYNLDGQIVDRRNELGSSYVNYMVWFLCATTLGIIAVRQLSK